MIILNVWVEIYPFSNKLEKHQIIFEVWTWDYFKSEDLATIHELTHRHEIFLRDEDFSQNMTKKRQYEKTTFEAVWQSDRGAF